MPIAPEIYASQGGGRRFDEPQLFLIWAVEHFPLKTRLRFDADARNQNGRFSLFAGGERSQLERLDRETEGDDPPCPVAKEIFFVTRLGREFVAAARDWCVISLSKFPLFYMVLQELNHGVRLASPGKGKGYSWFKATPIDAIPIWLKGPTSRLPLRCFFLWRQLAPSATLWEFPWFGAIIGAGH